MPDQKFEERESERERELVSWYFEPSQPQRITSHLKTMFNLSPTHSAREPPNHKNPQATKPILTQIHTKQSTHKHRTQNLGRTSPHGIIPAKQTHKARQDTLASRTTPSTHQYQIFKKYEKGMDRSIKNFFLYMHNSKYQCHMAACCTYHRPTYFS